MVYTREYIFWVFTVFVWFSFVQFKRRYANVFVNIVFQNNASTKLSVHLIDY